MSEEVQPVPEPAPPVAGLPPVEGHRVFRLLRRGPSFWGLPVLHTFMVLGVAGIGFELLKIVSGTKAGMYWVGAMIAVWAVLTQLHQADPIILWSFLRAIVLRPPGRLLATIPGRVRVVVVDE